MAGSFCISEIKKDGYIEMLYSLKDDTKRPLIVIPLKNTIENGAEKNKFLSFILSIFFYLKIIKTNRLAVAI